MIGVPDSRGNKPFLASLLLALQLVVAGFVPLVDAVLESGSRDGPHHVETRNGAPCPPGHDHLNCQFCRFAGNHFTAPPVATLPVNATRERLGSAAVDVSLAHTAHTSPLGPRAPPIA
jgi:hypothetical protein